MVPEASLPDRQPGPESGSGALGADGADVSDVQVDGRVQVHGALRSKGVISGRI